VHWHLLRDEMALVAAAAVHKRGTVVAFQHRQALQQVAPDPKPYFTHPQP
jgi:hypothetical protein